MDQDEKREQKQLEKEAANKAGAVGVHVAADYFTGGQYETVRNAPVVGKMAKSAEKGLGKILANAPTPGPVSKKTQRKAIKKLDDAGGLDIIDNMAGAISGSKNQADVDAIKNRGKNQADFSKNFSRKKKEENGEEIHRQKKSDLENDHLNNQKETKEKDSSKSNNGQLNKKEALNSVMNNKNGSTLGLKAKILKLKITLIVIGVLAAIFAFVILVAYLSYAWDAWTNAISSFFGISEVDTEENMSVEEADGLFDNEDYQYDENGNPYSMEELVVKLKDDPSCTEVTFWNSIADALSGFDEPCELLRYLNKTIDKFEETNEGVILDRSLIISTIFYGYTAQPYYDDYTNPESADERIPSVNHYESLVDVLKDGKIQKGDIKKIVENSIADTSFTYYTWEIEESESGKTTGNCKPNKVRDIRYSLKKWKLFMRYGEEVADVWEKDIKKVKQYQASDEQCNGSMTKEELKSFVDKLAPNVTKALNDSPGEVSMNESLFEQAADIENDQLDVFQNYTSISGKTYEFDYKNGYVYIDFPAFKKAIDNPEININYDEVVTPKEIETIIQYAISKKHTLNEILQYEDPDNPDRYLGSYNGYSSVVLGAYCGDLLTAPLDQINVYVTDCDGQYITTTTMKEYIMGVAFLEVSHTEDDYVKAEMLAAKNYALNRRDNYRKGTTIRMRSGNCDQVYCPMSQGCHSEPSHLDCGGFKCTSYVPGGSFRKPASQEMQDTYAAYYDELADMLVIDKKTGKLANTSYVDTRQREWERSAKQGMNFTQIIVESYAKDGKDFEIIRCSEQSEVKTENETEVSDKYGNKPTEQYPKQAPDKGKFYGYSYNDDPEGQEITINPDWIDNNIVTINSNCADASWNKYYQVNKQARDNYVQAFSNVCKILKEGVKISSGETCKYTVADLQGGETFAKRKTINEQISDISYGITQNWNYNKEITVGNKTYKPYGSDRDLAKYNSFINALGKEEHCKNVNYILYKYAYKPAGFEWGGNWGRNGNSGTYNGMQFYVKY